MGVFHQKVLIVYAWSLWLELSAKVTEFFRAQMGQLVLDRKQS